MDLMRSIPIFDPTGPSVETRWARWKRGLEQYLLALNVSAEHRKRAVLLHAGGEALQDIVDGLPNPGTTYDETIVALDAHFAPTRNLVFERYQFLQITQTSDENIDTFAARLRQKAKLCEFGDLLEGMMTVQIVSKCKSQPLRKRMLQETDLTLEKALQIGRSHDSSENQLRSFEPSDASSASNSEFTAVNATAPRYRNYNRNKPQYKASVGNSNSNRPCDRCGNTNHTSRQCFIAKDKQCSFCHKIGHLEKVCYLKQRSQNAQIEVRDVEDSSVDANIANVFSVNMTLDTPVANVYVNGTKLRVLVDSGASVNTMTINDYKMLATRPGLIRADKNIFGYGSKTPLRIHGMFTAKVAFDSKEVDALFYVINSDTTRNLLCYKTSELLGLLKVSVNCALSDNSLSLQLQQEFPECFEGLGKLKDFQLHLHINKDIQPVAQGIRRIPFQLRERVENEIKQLVKLDVIEQVVEPTFWLNPVCPVSKRNGDLRICLDMRRANEAVHRVNYTLPTFDDVVQEMDGTAFISTLDLNMGFHQIELDEESRAITAFSVNSGVYRYKRLFFGISSAPELFQHLIQQTISGIAGARNIQDDIIVYGSTQEEHDARLRRVLRRLSERGLTLNIQKCKFRNSKIVFMGHELSVTGVCPTESKVKAIKDLRPPTTPSEVRSVLGLMSFCSRFIPNFAAISQPIRELTRQSIKWSWTNEHQDAFNLLKAQLARKTSLAYYNRGYPTAVVVDASPVGLGAILVQKHPDGSEKPVAYASRLLTDVERRYSQTEKEALSVIYACEHFQLYLIGTEFVVKTDHKPLEILYSPRSRPSARIERWVLRLQPFKFKVEYIKGTDNIADSLSRLTTDVPDNHIDEEDICHITSILSNAIPVAMNLKDIQEATKLDENYMKLMENVNNGKKRESDKHYLNVFDELSVCEGIILRNARILIPSSLRTFVIKLAHAGHQGVVRTKQRLRSKVWWPGMDLEVEKSIGECIPCQAVKPTTTTTKITATSLPGGPWLELAMDICGPFPTGEYVVVLVDYYSRWPEATIMKTTTSQAIIDWLESVFMRFGYPEQITTDNGRQFVSEQFQEYLQSRRIAQKLSPPYWPQANGLVERLNRSFQQAIEAATVEKRNWKAALQPFLFAYRNTTHPGTGKSPAELIFNRKINDGLPSWPADETDTRVNQFDRRYKQKYTDYCNRKRNVREMTFFKPGDQVLVKQMSKKKLSPNFDPTPVEVVHQHGYQVKVRHPDGHIFVRHFHHVKKVPLQKKKELLCSNIGNQIYTRGMTMTDDDSAAKNGTKKKDSGPFCG